MEPSTLICPTCKRSDHEAYKSPVSISFAHISSLARLEEDKCLSFEYTVPEDTAVMNMYVKSPIAYETADVIDMDKGTLLCQCREIISLLDLADRVGASGFCNYLSLVNNNDGHSSITRDGIMYAPLEFGHAAYGVRLARKLQVVVKFSEVVKDVDRDKYSLMIKVVSKV